MKKKENTDEIEERRSKFDVLVEGGVSLKKKVINAVIVSIVTSVGVYYLLASVYNDSCAILGVVCTLIASIIIILFLIVWPEKNAVSFRRFIGAENDRYPSLNDHKPDRYRREYIEEQKFSDMLKNLHDKGDFSKPSKNKNK